MTSRPATLDAQLVAVTEEHVDELAQRMRPEDAEECRAIWDMTPLDTVLLSLKHSTASAAALIGGEVAGIVGVLPHPLREGVGCPWLLTTDTVARHPKAFLRMSRLAVGVLLEEYAVLEAMVDERYAGALRWAKWLGFDIGPAEPYGALRAPFHPVSLRRAAWVR